MPEFKDPIDKLRAVIPPDRLRNVLIGMNYEELEVRVLAGLDPHEKAELLRAIYQAPGPKFWEQLVEERQYEWAALAMQEGPCDGCTRYHYTDETNCPIPDHGWEDEKFYQHSSFWYDCEPCSKCGADAVLLFGPPLPRYPYPEFPPASLARYYPHRTIWHHKPVTLTGDQIASQQSLTTPFVMADEVDIFPPAQMGKSQMIHDYLKALYGDNDES